ncbi:OCTN [Mytilus edulis]|uniref:SLC22A4_5 n=1 Tax=Mytilus edulis TaxID=6550 RepID=A0A8S3Q925_MYTED|nr:OCTN [Mytilus edulis]
MTDLNEYLEETIDKIGGFGPFQWILVLLIFGSKITDNWSTLMMTFGGAVPNWRCNLTTLYGLEYKAYNISEVCVLTASNISWDLVCERSWIPSTITSLQMGGVIAGGFVSGQMADTIGRKLTYVSALSALFVPESFRWLVTHWKIQKAYHVIKRLAKINNKKPPEYEKFHAEVIQVEDLVSEGKKYSILDIIDNPRLLKFTLLLMVAWFSCGYGAYGIFFGVGQLAGNIYINLILLNVVGFVQVTGWYFANW